MLRLSTYFQCWEKSYICKEDILLGLPTDYSEKVRSQFNNHYITTETEMYTQPFINCLRDLDIISYDCVFENGIDVESLDVHHRLRSKDWLRHLDLCIQIFWAEINPRIKNYAAHSDFINADNLPVKETTTRLRFNFISSRRVIKGINFGTDIPRDVTFLGYQL